MTLSNTGRLTKLIRALKSPSSQKPSFILFVDKGNKTAAIRELFPKNNFKKSRANKLASISMDNTTSQAENPVFFMQSCPSKAFPPESAVVADSLMLPWAAGMSDVDVYNSLCANLLFMLADVICIFAGSVGLQIITTIPKYPTIRPHCPGRL